MKELLTSNLGRALTVLPFIMLANNLFGAVLAELKEKFDSNRLKAGLTKGIVIYVGIGLFAVASIYLKELTVEFNGDLYSLIDAMYVIIWGAIVVYSTDGLSKLSKIFKVETGDLK